EITHETLYHCHKVFYNPSNMTLSVVGNVDPESVIKMALEMLPVEPGEVPERDYGGKETSLPHQSEISASMEVSAPQFLFGAKLEPKKSGKARLRQMITGEIALRLLMGLSSPFFTRLYADGLLNNSFEYELDYTAGTAMILAGGESKNVEGVMNEFRSEIAKIASEGLSAELFENTRKSYYGSQLRILGSFSALSQSLADGAFADYCPLDAFEEINSISLSDVQNFIMENFTPEKLALSVISPL
ncbi:MAG: M16 family metallopeptidase, partial [Oscillospiraceae bacterium]